MPTRCTTSPCERSPPSLSPCVHTCHTRFWNFAGHAGCVFCTGAFWWVLSHAPRFLVLFKSCLCIKTDICVSGRLCSLALYPENGPLLIPHSEPPVARRPPCERALAQASRAHRSTLNRTEVSNKYHSPAAVDNHAPPGTVRNPTNTILSNRAGVRFSNTRAKHGDKKGIFVLF